MVNAITRAVMTSIYYSSQSRFSARDYVPECFG